ncbi:MAG: cupin domain-containing protein [Bryobacteraceae bacterium]
MAAQPFLNKRDADVFRFLGAPTAMRASGATTDGAFALMEHWSAPPGYGSPLHTHTREDESFYIVEGEVAFICDGKWMKAGPSDFVFGPKNVPHGFQVVGNQPARIVILCNPAGFEDFVFEMKESFDTPPGPPDVPRLIEAAAKRGIVIHGPLPEIPADL